MDINLLTVASARTAILERQTSAVALAESFYEKIEAEDEKIGAYLTLTRERALKKEAGKAEVNKESKQ